MLSEPDLSAALESTKNGGGFAGAAISTDRELT
jgi:hypothetical protein